LPQNVATTAPTPQTADNRSVEEILSSTLGLAAKPEFDLKQEIAKNLLRSVVQGVLAPPNLLADASAIPFNTFTV